MNEIGSIAIHENSILRASPDSKTHFSGFARVVKVNEENVVALVPLDVFKDKPFNVNKLGGIFTVSISDLIFEIENYRIHTGQVFNTEIWASKEQLSDCERKIVNNRLELIKDLIVGDEIYFNSTYRGRRFKEIAEKYGESKRTVRRIFYLYLWGGQTELALTPRLYLRGGPNKQQKSGTRRRGRKDVKHAEFSEVILPEVRKVLEKGARQLYLPGDFTLTEAFVITRDRYFSIGAKLTRLGALEEILLPPSQLPSERQFRYVCEQLELKEGKRRKLPRQLRKRKVKFEFRGKSRDNVPGPGFRFEIDPATLQVDLVSRLNRAKLIGNATLYLIVDLFSGAYTGYALSLQGESWGLAAKSLFCCFLPKSVLFERLKHTYERNGIPCPYDDNDWPCNELPTKFTADRGALVSNKAGLIPEIGITLEIAPSGRPESKGKVEEAIKEAKHHNFYRIPGRYPKFLKRREESGKKSAALTLDELELIILEIIMDLNNEPAPLENIPVEMIANGETDITHIGIYKWGLKNRPGFTRTLGQKEVCTHLLSKGTASVTPHGIYFKKANFVSKHLFDSGYTMEADIKGNYPIEIRYDEIYSDKILYLDSINNDWVVAENDNEEIRRMKVSFIEWEMYCDEVNDLRKETRYANIRRRFYKAITYIRPMINFAKNETRLARRLKSISNSRTKIRENRKIDIEANNILDEFRSQSFIDRIFNERESGGKKGQDFTELGDNGNESKAKVSISQLSKDLWTKKNDHLDK